MANNTTSTNSIFSSANARMAGAAPVVWAGDILAAGAEVCRKAAEFIGGGQEKRVVGYNYLAARTTGSLTKSAKAAMTAAAKAAMEEKHSDMVQKKGHRWVPSQKAVDAAKKSGHEKALIPHLYTAANWLAACADEDASKVYTAGNGTAHTYAGWAFTSLRKHASFLKGKNVKNAESPEAMLKYFELAAKKAAELTDKSLPTWESICEYVQKEGVAAKAEPAPAAEPAVAAVKEEPRDGRAPKKAVTPKKGVTEAIRSLGYSRLTKKAAFEIAQKAAEAAENGEIDESMRNAIIEACAAKDGGDPEEFYALMGEN